MREDLRVRQAGGRNLASHLCASAALREIVTQKFVMKMQIKSLNHKRVFLLMNNAIIQSLFALIIYTYFSLMSLTVLANEAEHDPFLELTTQGDAFYQQGRFQEAAKSWENSLAWVGACTDNTAACIDILRRLAAAYQALGLHSAVVPTLERALSLAEHDLKRRALVSSQLSDVWLSMRHSDKIVATEAQKPNELEYEYWHKTCSLACASVVDAKLVKAPIVLAGALNSYGNALAVLEDHFLKTRSDSAITTAIEACLLTHSQMNENPGCQWDQILVDDDDAPFANALQTLSTAYHTYEQIAAQNSAQDADISAAMNRLEKSAMAVMAALPKSAMRAYEKSAVFAKQAGDLTLAFKASLNRLRVGVMSEQSLDEVVIGLDELWQHIKTQPEHDTINLLSMGTLALKVLQENEQIDWLSEDFVGQNKLLTQLSQPKKQQVSYQAYLAFQEAARIAQNEQDAKTLERAYGYLGELYEQAQRYEEALKLTRRAIFFANQNQVPYSAQDTPPHLEKNPQPIQNVIPLTGHFSHFLYQWYWQAGRIFQQLGRLDDAIASYRLASHNLKPIQQILEVGSRISVGLFDQVVKPVHYGYAELLLEKVALLNTDPQAQQTLLRKAIDTVERVKVAELQNYFDECVLALHAKTNNLLDLNHSHLDASVLQKTALLYPIPLPDQLVMLVKVLDQNDIHHYTIPITNEQLNDTVVQFRFNLQKRSHNRFLFQAKTLYDWLIRPIERLLNDYQVDTLVVVPDGYLRMIPFSTLHDGQQFLIEKYAMALTPGLTLVDPKPIKWDNKEILLAGLSNAVQGHSSLPNIPTEMVNLQCLTQGAADQKLISLLTQSFAKTFSIESCRQQVMNTGHLDNALLFNQDFSLDNFQALLKMNKYSIIHIATHGEFDADPEHTYLLNYQSHIKMDQLEKVIGLNQFRHRKPLELLTLSACKTAVGDDRAALGLAGVAVKSGARSALATLWYVEDDATSKAISEFYRQLLNTPNLSKAKALQKAQTKLIAQKYYWHPGYWGPFLLIGNWL